MNKINKTTAFSLFLVFVILLMIVIGEKINNSNVDTDTTIENIEENK